MQRRREMLMSDLLFAADRLRGEGFFERRELVDDSHWLVRQFGASRCEDRGYFGHHETITLGPSAFGRSRAERCGHCLIDKPSSNCLVVIELRGDRARGIDQARRGNGRLVRIGEHGRILSFGPLWSAPFSPPPLQPAGRLCFIVIESGFSTVTPSDRSLKMAAER